jgi:hypothetical protein
MWLETWERRCKDELGCKNKLVKNEKLKLILVKLSISYRFQINKTSSNTFHIATPTRVWIDPSISSSVKDPSIHIYPFVPVWTPFYVAETRRLLPFCRSRSGQGKTREDDAEKIRVWRIGEDLPVLFCARSCCGCEGEGLLLLLCRLQQMITYIF